jgi:hypothetical protein
MHAGGHLLSDHGQIVTFGVAFCLVLAVMVGLRHGLDRLVRLDARVPTINPKQLPTSTELVAFEKILERRGSRGVWLAVVVGLVVCVSIAALIRSEMPTATDSRRIEGDDVAVMYGLLAGFLFYVVRLMRCRCPRCGRRLIGLWTLHWLAGHMVGSRAISQAESLAVTRCPHCETPFRWTREGGPAQPGRRTFLSP